MKYGGGKKLDFEKGVELVNYTMLANQSCFQ